MSHVEQLERDTEQTREQIANTLDELRACMTPGHVLDQVADRFNEGAPAAFARNLKDQAVNNPLPIALIGAGMTWLMLGGSSRVRSATASARRSATRAANALGETAGSMADSVRATAGAAADSVREATGSAADSARAMAGGATDSAREATGSMADSAWDAKDSARERTREAAASANEMAGSMADSAQRTASAGYEAIADGARRTTSSVSESARAAGQRTLRSGNALLDFCREQPLVLAGLGLAFGAVMGALLPASDAEDRLVGQTSDRVKKGAQDLAAEQYEKARKVGERAAEAAKDETAKQADQQAKSDESKAGHEAGAGEVRTDGATLVPADQSELERQGQPWTAENAPL
jgi:hypothetical protein